MEKTNPDWRPRIYVDVDEETFRDYNTMIPHGLKSKVLEPLVKSLMKLLKSSPGEHQRILGLILAGKVTAEHFVGKEEHGTPSTTSDDKTDS